ncbi:uncharacterized protein DSM5745_09026 [Aspergillus mulundensis]|uniref:Uncharacterized protein n=1 Tax=Aspergillus mulundensis TaxID=1810919 RepID=A0A3D8QZR4_9EURO|nr:Uncharacterized protein DSM5745_09026 [Aspergillus mulundensis]RDW67160.1 Uncharacterized protein DSM5745_09026 [Aspergillus mulundensis]
MDRSRSILTPRSLSPVPEEEGRDEENVRDVKSQIEELTTEAETESETDNDLPLEISVHGVKAKVYLNCADVDIVPTRYLEKADRSPLLKRTPWIFRAVANGRSVNISKWSKVDIRYRGVFKTLKKAPSFNGLFGSYTTNVATFSATEDHEGESFTGQMSSDSRPSSDSGSFSSFSSSKRSSSSKANFEDALKAQGQAVYALLDEVLMMLKIKREAESHREVFFLKPRLLTCQPEYWTGYRQKHRDGPFTAGSVSLDYEPDRGTPRATSDPTLSLKKALEGEFKLLLAQLLVNVHRLGPKGDKIPDQEAFLIALHGSKLHILRGIFPGQKTSKLWSGRHNPNTSDMDRSTHNLFSNIGDNSSKNGIGGSESRFYNRTNLERFMEQVEWNQLAHPENEIHPRSFQIFGSREYDLWLKWEFAAAVKMLAGLIMYLMSGQARCGVLQYEFERYPYDEGLEPESDVGDDADVTPTEKIAMEQQEVEEEEERLKRSEKERQEEEQARLSEFEAIKGSVKDKIGGLADGLRQPWWDWVWEDKGAEAPKDEDEMIVGGPH